MLETRDIVARIVCEMSRWSVIKHDYRIHNASEGVPSKRYKPY